MSSNYSDPSLPQSAPARTPTRELDQEADSLLRQFYSDHDFDSRPPSAVHPPSRSSSSDESSSQQLQPPAMATSRLKNHHSGDSVSNKAVVALVVVIVILTVGAIAGGLFLSQPSDANSKLSGLTPTSLPKEFPKPITSPKAHVEPVDEDASPEPSPSLKPSPTVTPSPSSSASPTTSSKVELSVEELQLEDPQTGTILSAPFFAGQRVTVRAKLKNLGTADAALFSSVWSINGSSVGSNSTGKLKAAATAVYDDVNSITAPTFFLKTDSNTITYSVDTTNLLSDNKSNNSKTLTIQASSTRSDLEAVTVVFYEQGTAVVVTTPSLGQKLTARAMIKNNGQDKQTNFSLRWYVNDAQVKEYFTNSWINPSNSLEINDGYDFPALSGTNSVKVEINTSTPFPETNSSNNTKTLGYTL